MQRDVLLYINPRIRCKVSEVPEGSLTVIGWLSCAHG